MVRYSWWLGIDFEELETTFRVGILAAMQTKRGKSFESWPTPAATGLRTSVGCLNSSGCGHFHYVFDDLFELCSWSNCFALCRSAKVLVFIFCIWVTVGLIKMIHEAVKTLVIATSKGAAASAGYAGMSHTISNYIGYDTTPHQIRNFLSLLTFQF